MKHKTLLWLMLLFFPLALGTSCNTEADLKSIRYEGEVLALTRDGKNWPYNPIRVTKSSSRKGVPVGVTLGFIGNGYDKRMSEGDIVHFHVISFKEWQWPKTADLRWPTYIGIVEFYDSE